MKRWVYVNNEVHFNISVNSHLLRGNKSHLPVDLSFKSSISWVSRNQSQAGLKTKLFLKITIFSLLNSGLPALFCAWCSSSSQTCMQYCYGNKSCSDLIQAPFLSLKCYNLKWNLISVWIKTTFYHFQPHWFIRILGKGDPCRHAAVRSTSPSVINWENKKLDKWKIIYTLEKNPTNLSKQHDF